MSAVTHHFLRRGLEMSHQHFTANNANNGDDGDGNARKVSGWALVMLIMTGFVFAVTAFAIQYAYGIVVATLTVVEDPEPNPYLSISPNDNDDGRINKSINNDHPEDEVAPPKPITSKIRTTIRHLRSRGGRFAPFRGLRLFILWGIMHGILSSIFTLGSTPKHSFVYASGQIAAEIVLSTVEMGWVHIVISEPSPKSMFKRIPAFRSWSKIAPAVAVKAVASQLSYILPVYLALTLNAFRIDDNTHFLVPVVKQSTSWKMLLVSLLSIVLTVLIEIPATVTMVRVAASMLPEDDEAIVPFDRTFGGKVTPAVVGGAGKVGLLDAWKTFTWPSRVRLMKVLAKVFGMLAAITAALTVVFVVEFFAIIGGSFDLLQGTN